MGFTGGYIAARSGNLEELLKSQGIASEGTWDLAEGWQWAQYLEQDGADKTVTDLARELGTPVVGAFFLDSDFAFVDGVTDKKRAWSGFLRPDLAEEYEMPVAEFSLDAEVAGALAWSAEAGLTPDEALIRAALTAEDAFAEDLFHVLLAGLGVPGATRP